MFFEQFKPGKCYIKGMCIPLWIKIEVKKGKNFTFRAFCNNVLDLIKETLTSQKLGFSQAKKVASIS